VLLEISDHEDEAHARSLLEAGLDPEAGAPVVEAVVARSLAESEQLWRLRETDSGGPGARRRKRQARHLAACVLHRRLREGSRTAAAQRFDWAQAFAFGHLGDGNLHYNVGCRDGLSPPNRVRPRAGP